MMPESGRGASAGRPANDERMRDEHPAVVLQDLEGRRRPAAHIVAFANEKGGFGKSTFAFHCAVALTPSGMKVLVVDCERRQQSLQHFLEGRDGTAGAPGVPLPRPSRVVLAEQGGGLLLQGVRRGGRDGW